MRMEVVVMRMEVVVMNGGGGDEDGGGGDEDGGGGDEDGGGGVTLPFLPPLAPKAIVSIPPIREYLLLA